MNPTSSEIHLEVNLKLYIFLFEFMHHICIETNAVVVDETHRTIVMGLIFQGYIKNLVYYIKTPTIK